MRRLLTSLYCWRFSAASAPGAGIVVEHSRGSAAGMGACRRACTAWTRSSVRGLGAGARLGRRFRHRRQDRTRPRPRLRRPYPTARPRAGRNRIVTFSRAGDAGAYDLRPVRRATAGDSGPARTAPASTATHCSAQSGLAVTPTSLHVYVASHSSDGIRLARAQRRHTAPLPPSQLVEARSTRGCADPRLQASRPASASRWAQAADTCTSPPTIQATVRFRGLARPRQAATSSECRVRRRGRARRALHDGTR